VTICMASGRTNRTARWRKKQRMNVWRKHGKRCYWCGCPLNDKSKGCRFTIDHIIPRANGGGSTMDNMVPSCRKCNLRKGHMSGYEFCIMYGLMPLEGDIL
jgi:5-methylcytosine-specific restriction endonuclease McrA